MARQRLAGHVYRTPIIYSHYQSQLIQGEVYLKLESLQLLNSFKPRGVTNKVLSLDPLEREQGIILASSGNFGAAAAYVGSRWHVPTTVYAPKTAPDSKVSKIRRHDVDLVLTGDTFDEAATVARRTASNSPALWLDAADEDIVAGYGTIGFEVLDDVPNVDSVLVPVGSGGLITGISLALKETRPGTEVLGVQPAACPAFAQSLLDGVCYAEYHSEPSLCDALIGGISRLPFDYAPYCIDGVLLVDEPLIRRAVVDLLREDRVVSEPSGAIGAAAIVKEPNRFAGKRVVIVVSGGNIDYRLLHELMSETE